MEEQEDKRGFKVQDRRRFSPETGEAREAEGAGQAAENPTQAAAAAEGTARTEEEPRREPPRGGSRPAGAQSEIAFSSFVLGLSTQALMYMGEIPSAPGQPVQTDLIAAQQMIDVLAMLKQKTAGNLDAGEAAMLENALFDLRMRYVDLAKKGAHSPQEPKQ
jgi:uncharacterized protein DUF1844